MQAVMQARQERRLLLDPAWIGDERVLHGRTVDPLKRQFGSGHRHDTWNRISERVDISHDLDLTARHWPVPVGAQDGAVAEVEHVGVAARGKERKLRHWEGQWLGTAELRPVSTDPLSNRTGGSSRETLADGVLRLASGLPMTEATVRRILVAISGASGAIYGIRTLEALAGRADVETHLIISSGARKTIAYETTYTIPQVAALATVVHDEGDLAAKPSSGSFQTSGMIVAPCSIRTMASIANSLTDNLITRAADVHLKEKRKLILVVRETPLHAGHLRHMYDLAMFGAVILPPAPAFYHLPKTIDDIVAQTVGKVLDQLGIEHELFRRWSGQPPVEG